MRGETIETGIFQKDFRCTDYYYYYYKNSLYRRPISHNVVFKRVLCSKEYTTILKILTELKSSYIYTKIR